MKAGAWPRGVISRRLEGAWQGSGSVSASRRLVSEGGSCRQREKGVKLGLWTWPFNLSSLDPAGHPSPAPFSPAPRAVCVRVEGIVGRVLPTLGPDSVQLQMRRGLQRASWPHIPLKAVGRRPLPCCRRRGPQIGSGMMSAQLVLRAAVACPAGS